jgi:hypothetical protein
MTDDDKAKRIGRWAALAFGLVFVGIGLPFVLMWAGVIVPDRARLHAPLWVIGCAGLAFVLAGISVALNAAAPVQTKDGTLPASAPKPLRIAQDLMGLGIVAGLALVGTWAAVAPGPIKGSGTFAGVTLTASGQSSAGRVMFGFGALICWLVLAALTWRTIRKYRAAG